MELIDFFDYIKKAEIAQLAVTIGDFDGVHLGHQKLFDETIKYASNNPSVKTAVITFSPHPDIILKNKSDFELTSLNEKYNLMKKWNFDYLIIIPFTRAFSGISPEEFINKFLLRINVREVIVGTDFSFGKYGKGRPEQIPLYSNNKINVMIIDEICCNDKKISSTDIRKYLSRGALEMVRKCLGRNYSFSGEVIRGKQIGSTLNLPTANIKVTDNFIELKHGVYAVKVIIDDEQYYGMMNVGHNPSFNYSNHISIEINIFHFDKNIYGKKLIVECFEYIRSEMKFNSKQEFLEQIKRDQETIIKYFGL